MSFGLDRLLPRLPDARFRGHDREAGFPAAGVADSE